MHILYKNMEKCYNTTENDKLSNVRKGRETMQEQRSFQLGIPSYITVETEVESFIGKKDEAIFKEGDICVEYRQNEETEEVWLQADTTQVKTVKLRWNTPVKKESRILGGVWERTYGDVDWKGLSGTRFMPWYFMAAAGDCVQGYGVKVRPSSMCFWQADTRGITLVMDVRCGGTGVVLSGRNLCAAQIVAMETTGMSTFESTREFCKKMCTDPIFPGFPVYGSNNWYYAYGDSSEEEILKDTDYIVDLTKGLENRPYMVIDDCWQEHHRLDDYNGGPWKKGNEKFPDMKALAGKLEEKGVRPGIWVRFLLNEEEIIPQEWRISHNGCLDPSHPDALQYIKEDVERICEWGYTLIKHDFTTYDLFGRWGMEMNPFPTQDGWHFYDTSKTSAEIVLDLYQAIYDVAAKHQALVLGCNTIGHLGAGLMHMQRTGDDTSGINWERTKKMGVNTLAFCLPQHGTFFDVDADCVGITGSIPWDLNKQWADVVAESGTSLFVSAKPGVLTEEEKEDLRQIMAKASKQEVHKIPLDWEYTDCPEVWGDEEEEVEYNWYEEAGSVARARNNQLYYSYVPLS